jgi:hypothetical protein
MMTGWYNLYISASFRQCYKTRTSSGAEDNQFAVKMDEKGGEITGLFSSMLVAFFW